MFSCSPIKDTPTEIVSKGKSTFKIFKNKSAVDKAVIQGFVYSSFDGEFMKYANITIDKELKIGVQTNEFGFFKCEVDPGIYMVECFYVGYKTEISEKIKVEEGDLVNIVFEIGIDMVH